MLFGWICYGFCGFPGLCFGLVVCVGLLLCSWYVVLVVACFVGVVNLGFLGFLTSWGLV